MNYYIEVGYDLLNKHNEELCGDQVEVVRTEDAIIAVLSDGLGTGVKANILSTLTAKIATTMLKHGSSLSEVIDTVTSTLPICKVRDIAYSTFSILYIKNNGEAYIAIFDNPLPFYYAKEKNAIARMEGKTCTINGKKITEFQYQLQGGDCITMVSDGIIHAGVGEILNYGWEWEHVAQYLESICPSRNALMICKSLTSICNDLYEEKPGDDASVLTIKLKKPEFISIFTGPPILRERDAILVDNFMKSLGRKIICGGTAANIVGREIGKELTVDIETLTAKIPPISYMEGIDLITEGVLTMEQALKLLKDILNKPISVESMKELQQYNGAAMLARRLLHQSTHVNFFLGHSLNLAHKENDISSKLGKKFKIVGEMINTLRKLGKTVSVYYF
ncbi:SpoIIE family protein phosphatase [Clostridium formicaceticum]|uniref:Stage II sporulation protein E (SpoIIE) n=1 Tax=Clostridium formicaceticum TaxID=1497 RepID=A0AAC9RH30_9CLOT|nr:SpoIIE family protein phosphatase [Clostridium formicaceticum]AOY76415.1 hypothetical protein BJL90_11155 [Clostridium formicaceticum]ARE86809.1 Stage II sporulation protein E (SpoIIE) [Clostridium formicaceticum]